MDIDRLHSVGLVIIRPKSPQSDRKSDLLKIFRPECVKLLTKVAKILATFVSIFKIAISVEIRRS